MSSRNRRRGIARSLVSAIAAAAVVATSLAATSVGAQAAPQADPPPAAEKIKPELTKALQAKMATDFWVRFGDQADLSQAGRITDWNERGTAVAAALRKTAAESQAKVRAELDGMHLKYEAFWGTNAIKVSGGSMAHVQKLAAFSEVEGLYAPVQYVAPKVDKDTSGDHTTMAVEWGIANINADDVWSTYGAKGAGIVIANIDTGVQFDHPALVNQYRGKKADGTFDHNYNWFNAAGTCAAAPCDANGHGTHTMGTMAGSDGGANQIGVAPDVKWIAANGCCPSDAALITSGQWMLEPTNLAGQNPDASKRPNIINNSWGSQQPSNDPFMEDIALAWEASGIFGMWANGNGGALGCQSSGSPGSRIINYSAGNYDINNNINNGSGRGTGQDGEIKPNISAPGTNVRSAIPGSGYANFSGTSMASPHVAGAIALLWSAAPSLVGNVAATKALLDNTASDKDSAQCGGTADDNNVYGEGRLDALALLNAAPIGDTGTLTGKVTNTATGAGIAGATITVTGPTERQLTTGADGTYTTQVTAGDYSLAVAAFGFKSVTGTATVTANATTTKDFALESAPTVNVGGTITDGSGHGWPLYAKVTVEGPGGVFDFTTPTNGRYSFQVPSNATYNVKIESQIPGYETVTKPVVVGAGNATLNVAVPVRGDSCLSAPGYVNGSDGVYETFESGAAPTGWTVVDNQVPANGQVWTFNNPGNRANLTGGSGKFAIADSDKYGSGGKQNTSLVSPKVDLTAVAAPVIKFGQDFNYLGGEKANVELSIDGGATWETVLTQATADVRGVKEIAIPQAAGKAEVQVRFHYFDASYDWWWQVDNVLIGSKVICQPVNGGLVTGHVTDTNTGAAVNGAVVTSGDKPAETTTTVSTPADTGLADGFYWLFSSVTGSHPFTAKAGNYTSKTTAVDVEADWTTLASFALDAGRLSVSPGTIETTLRMPTGKTTKSFTVTNTGKAPVDVEFGEVEGDVEILGADGSRKTRSEIEQSEGAPLQRLQVATSFGQKLNGKMPVPAAKPGISADPWAGISNYPSTVMDNRTVSLDGKIYSIAGGNGSASSANNYVYDPAAKTWTAIAPLPGARNAVTAGAVGGKIIVSSGWGASGPDAATWSYDPAANAWTAVKANPAPRAAAGQAVLDGKLYAIGGCTTAACTPMSNTVVRYDPASDTWETLANYPASVAFAACGAVGDAVVCTGGNNGTAGQKTGASYDPSSNTWTPIADAPADNWAASVATGGGKLLVVGGVQGAAVTNAGFAYDADANAWSSLPNANTARYRGGAACGFYKVGGSSGGFTATVDSEVLPGFEDCDEAAADVSWLTIDQKSVTLAPAAKVVVKVTTTAAVDQPGKYTAGISIKENTPYSVAPVGVTMNVNPPTTWGKLSGTVTGINCQGISVAIPGATVQVDSWAMSFTFTTDATGGYAYWLDRRNNPLTIIAAKDGWKPQVRQSSVNVAEPTVEDFALKPVKC